MKNHKQLTLVQMYQIEALLIVRSFRIGSVI